MKKFVKSGRFMMAVGICVLCMGGTVSAASQEVFKEGIYAENINLSGLSKEEAEAKIEAFIEDRAAKKITLVAADGNEIVVTAKDLGLRWRNPGMLDEALALGTEGNVIQRYKAMKDLMHDNKVYDIEFGFNSTAINELLLQEGGKFDQTPVDAKMVRTENGFSITDGRIGYALDVEGSIGRIYNYLDSEWDGDDCRIDLVVEVEKPKGMAEDLQSVTDLLGTFTTDLATSNANRINNVSNGCNKLNGSILFPGEELSVIDKIGPFTKANGYAAAGTFVNGKVVDGVGGGICQVSTTLYDAVLLSELEVTERHNHSMTVTYVKQAEDAMISSGSGSDFRFVNNTEYPVYVEAYVKNKKCTVNIYGKETRPETHSVRYESEILSVNRPTSDTITADAGHAIGYIHVEGAHIGYKARLWKIVTENGIEVSREIVNNSNYKVSPRSAVVGVATNDPQKHEEIMAAIGTHNIDHVKNVIAILTQPAPAATE